MSGGKPVFVSVMWSPKARTRSGFVHRSASGSREDTSFSRRSRALVRAGQVRIACVTDSGSVPHRGHVGSGFLSNHEVCAARYLFAARIGCILPATNFPSPMKGCGAREEGKS